MFREPSEIHRANGTQELRFSLMFWTFGWLLQIPFAIFGGVISNRSLTTGWWFQRFFIFTPILGEMIQFHEYFSDGLKPPTRLSSGTLLLDLWIGSVQLRSSKRLGPEGCSLHISSQTLGHVPAQGVHVFLDMHQDGYSTTNGGEGIPYWVAADFQETWGCLGTW